MHRVQKLLSNYGYCSRRKAEELIEAGRVKVNNRVITIGDKALLNDKIYVDGKLVGMQKKVYLMMNKPVGCVTALKDSKYKTVMDYIDVNERVFPVGRLDFNTSGILLFTNDGDFANKVMHPSHEIEKTYLAGLDKHIKEEQIKHIEKGVIIDGRKTSPAKVKSLGKNIEITIHEGRNRIVRNILGKLGFRVKFLKRVKIGKLGLGNLEEGKIRHLNKEDIGKVFK